MSEVKMGLGVDSVNFLGWTEFFNYLQTVRF